MDKITMFDLLLHGHKVVDNYNRFADDSNLAERTIGNLRQTIEQYERDNHEMHTELEHLHLSHDWYVKYQQAQCTITDMQDTLDARDKRIEELERKVNNQRQQINDLQAIHAEAKLCKIPYSDRAYVRKLQEQLARKCERIEELKSKIAELEENIITLTLPK